MQVARNARTSTQTHMTGNKSHTGVISLVKPVRVLLLYTYFMSQAEKH
jgi:hypothetical protein